MEPKIRFNNNSWQKHKVGELCDLLTGYPFPGDKILNRGKNLLMRGINITEGRIRHSDEIDRYYNEDTIGLEKYRLQVGDLVIGMDGSKVGKNSALVTSKENYSLLVQRVARLRNEDKNLINLIQIAVGSDKFIKYVEEMKTSSAIPHISPADIRNFPLSLPEDSNERRLVASYFTSLDSQISASTSRLASLKQMKAASLQAMFPQEGETVPKIRFKGFEGEWKTCVLSSIATMHARIGWQNLRKDEFLSSGDYYLITGTDFHDGKISFETCHYIDKERYDQDKNIQLETDSILITKDGTLGKVAFVDSLDKPATLNAGVFNVKTKDKEIYPKYLFQYLKAPYLMDYVNKNATGGTIKHLNQNMLVNFPVQHPSYKEQVMIGDYLFNLDRQISLQSQRLEKLKQIKSACLDKMFV